eukprot:CAMPEP_0183345474 /NCGR_PEP_ID=MMETSP0164_2-20130417/10886_1 /TAXON_ID=221442 /ORGANISM="Coccolithus pelagicus ssp braarudi, Strain PLY182g" /LENGTH=323 /DNA_ID=CAMNT_0025516615 /DNA_START=15 /DNA_END=983 /DNA_ORIENTATION=-
MASAPSDAPSSTYVSRLQAAYGGAPPALAHYLKMGEPAIHVCLKIVDVVGPFYLQLFGIGYTIYSNLPFDLFEALLGGGLCFFGGAYCTSIAAVEAFRLCGWSTTRAALLDVFEEMKRVKVAHDADSKKDDDGDGVADIHQISTSELLQRKLAVAALAIKDPEKLSVALGGLWTAWIGVQGTLRFEFAKTITLAVSMAEMANPTALRLGIPVLAHVVPPKYHHWIPTIIKNVIKAVAVSIAWRMQVITSAAQSALRGGLMCARALLAWSLKKGYHSMSDEQTHIDEGAGYALAVMGFYCQFIWGFGCPFPLNLIMLPFSLVEW